jgi:hypothetical protein
MVKIYPVIQGANPPIAIIFTDANTDSVVSLVGCTGFSATAKHTLSGTVTPFTAAVLTDAANGKVRLDYTVGSFAELGIYNVQIKCADAAGNTLILPSEEGQLKIKVGAGN